MGTKRTCHDHPPEGIWVTLTNTCTSKSTHHGHIQRNNHTLDTLAWSHLTKKYRVHFRESRVCQLSPTWGHVLILRVHENSRIFQRPVDLKHSHKMDIKCKGKTKVHFPFLEIKINLSMKKVEVHNANHLEHFIRCKHHSLYSKMNKMHHSIKLKHTC
jgi:hypothetical protein